MPLPNSTVMVLVMVMFQYSDCLPASVNVFAPAAVHQHPAILQVLDAGSFGLQGGLQI